MSLPTDLRTLPWATFGRPESLTEMEGIIRNQVARAPLLPHRPLITLACLHRMGTDLSRTLSCLVAQSYSNWECLVVSDGKFDLPSHDSRIKTIVSSYSTIADAKNTAIQHAKGEWFGWVDSGDLVSPVALFQIVFEMAKAPDTVLFYCNETRYSASKNDLSDFWSKGAPSRFNLLHFNSIGRMWLAKTSLFQENKFQPNQSPEEEQGWFLRLNLLNLKWKHIPQYLYYRHEVAISSSIRRRELVEGHLKSMGMEAYVNQVQGQLDVQLIIQNPKDHLISVIILFKDLPDITVKCLEALQAQVGEVPVEILMMNNNSSGKSLAAIQKALDAVSVPSQIIDYPARFNFGHMNNELIRKHAKGDLLLVLNNDVFLEGGRVLDQMAGWALLESTGSVGIRLHYESGKVQHSGLDATFGGFSRLVRVGNAQGKDRFVRENHEVFGNTFACCMLKRETYNSVGGFREVDLANGFGDIAFNFECLRK